MSREDISEYLIHFTKGDDEHAAFDRIRTILAEQRLVGSSNNIRGGHKCVCFSEAPLAALEKGLLNSSAYSRYSPFGILFNKIWIYEQGGRPVIYQLRDEYEQLPESHSWRHVTYDPVSKPTVDFTWEREWRISAEELRFDGSHAAVVVPNGMWADRLVKAHDRDERFRVLEYMQIMDEEIAISYQKDFEWFIFTLSA